jgi:uncharacterized protein (TIGR02996 family)
VSDQRALLAAICAHPDEDTPRLAYADWLDEYTGSMPKPKRESVRMRAELIRVQCELARLPTEEETADTAARRIELEFRQEVLLKNGSRRRAWAKPINPLPEYPDLVPSAQRFVRGFPFFCYHGDVAKFLTAGAALFDISPVEILNCGGPIDGAAADQFLALPWLARVRRAALRCGFLSYPLSVNPGPVRAALVTSTEKPFAAPGLVNLEDLELYTWEFGAPGAPIAQRALVNLRRLGLHSGIVPGPATFARLGELLPAQTRLRDFELSHLRYGADEIATLVALPQFRDLERLALGYRSGFAHPLVPPLGAAAVRAITAAPSWRTLRLFADEMGTGFTAPELEELSAAPPAPHLRALLLGSGTLGGAVAALAASPLLGSVTTLSLRGTPLGDEGALLLAKAAHLTRLVHLNVAGCNIGPKGIKAIAEAPFAANLVRLEIGGCPIRKGGIDALIAPKNFPRLKRLDASWAAKNAVQKNRLRARYGDAVRF